MFYEFVCKITQAERKSIALQTQISSCTIQHGFHVTFKRHILRRKLTFIIAGIHVKCLNLLKTLGNKFLSFKCHFYQFVSFQITFHKNFIL